MGLTVPPMVAWLSEGLGVAVQQRREPLQQEQARQRLWWPAPLLAAGRLWRRGAAAIGGRLPAARRLLAGGEAPTGAGARGEGPFWDWVEREERLGEIGFDVKA
jgi:hypothetical protein